MDKLFETERLIIRGFRDGDARKLYENHQDDEVGRWFPNERYADEEEAREAIGFYAGCVKDGKLPFVLGAVLKETGELVGDAGISEVDGKTDETEVGYCIGRQYRRRGYATELLDAFSGYAASRVGTRVIYGRVLHGNEASVRVLEKNGYRFVREESGAEDDPFGQGMLVYRKDI